MINNKAMRIGYPEFLLLAQARIEQTNPKKQWEALFDDLIKEIPKDLSNVEQKAIREALLRVRSSRNPASAWRVFEETYYRMKKNYKFS